jgi:magnesium chelatase subunit D
MQPIFPFSAVVGQDALKRALLLSVIQPSLGGVLIRGTKGVAKSTAVRALAALLPPLQTVVGCPFQRHPDEEVPGWPLPASAPVITRPTPLVELPLGATEDRVLGTLHLEKALRGDRAFEPGLLAAANRGLLYIDEVNLLPDHLVDVLLDAAASGTHIVEREGLSLRHPARFVLIGTMNPEEGDLRPQLLDRFGFAVDVDDLNDPAERAEAVRRRLAFEADPITFAEAWREADEAEAARLTAARKRVRSVRASDEVLRAVSERCLEAGVEGLRADLTLCRAACAWAAYQGREEVEAGDVDLVAELALAHRRTRPPEPPPEGRSQRSEVRGQKPDGTTREEGSQPGNGNGGAIPEGLQVFPSAGLFAPRVRPDARTLARSAVPGRWRKGDTERRGPPAGRMQVFERGCLLSWAGTLRARALRGEKNRPLQMDDLRGWRRRGPAGCLLLFVLDASGSMAAWQRMRQTKAAVLALLTQAYQRRDRVALLAFRGTGAELVLPPAHGLRPARQALEALPVGGTTPLAHGLAAACRLVRGELRRQPRQPIWTVLLTDGRTNVAAAGGDPWQEALAQGRALAACGAEVLVVDTETGRPRFGRAGELARVLGAACLPLEEVLGRPLHERRRPAV